MGDLVTMGADDFFFGLGHSLEILAIGLDDLEVRRHDHDAFVGLLYQELRNPFFEGYLVLGISQAFLCLTQDGEEPADVVIQEADTLRLETSKIDKDIAASL